MPRNIITIASVGICKVVANSLQHPLHILINLNAFVAQGLEHWSCKPGVESSNLSEGFFLLVHVLVKLLTVVQTL